MTTLFHGSNDSSLTEILETSGGDVDFGGLFFSPDRESASSNCLGPVALFECEVDENEIADTRELRLWADDIVGLDLDASVDEIEAAVEDSGDSWECQALRGRIARALGFRAVEMSDEHGVSYLVFPGKEIKKI